MGVNMTTKACNSLNIGQQGVVYFDGVSQFSGLDGSTIGNLMTSNGPGVAPSFQAPGAGGLQIIKSSNIDMTALGAVTLFTPASDFIIFGITAYLVALTGVSSGPIASFGWTGPGYADITNGYSAFPTLASGNYFNNMSFNSNEVAFLPAGTPFKINITTAEITASVNMQRMDIFGYNV